MIPVSAAVPICSHCLARPDMIEVFRFSLHRCRVEGPSRTSGLLPGPDQAITDADEPRGLQSSRCHQMRHPVTDPPGDAEHERPRPRRRSPEHPHRSDCDASRLGCPKPWGIRMKDCVCHGCGILLKKVQIHAPVLHMLMACGCEYATRTSGLSGGRRLRLE